MSRLFGIESGFQSGAFNMALDEALLEHVRLDETAGPTLVVRTYQWEKPTLSLGVNQPERDLPALMMQYGPSVEIVRRPTGGRAILHGEDVSFSFVTNNPALLRASLKESYRMLNGFVKTMLDALGLQAAESGEKDGRAYLRSPVCFQTCTDSDLVLSGQKLAGSAQLRRANGLLQHGAAFVQAYGVSGETFTQALFRAVSDGLGRPVRDFPLEAVMAEAIRLAERYQAEGSDIRRRASTTSGSHLAPASF